MINYWLFKDDPNWKVQLIIKEGITLGDQYIRVISPYNTIFEYGFRSSSIRSFQYISGPYHKGECEAADELVMKFIGVDDITW